MPLRGNAGGYQRVGEGLALRDISNRDAKRSRVHCGGVPARGSVGPAQRGGYAASPSSVRVPSADRNEHVDATMRAGSLEKERAAQRRTVEHRQSSRGQTVRTVEHETVKRSRDGRTVQHVCPPSPPLAARAVRDTVLSMWDAARTPDSRRRAFVAQQLHQLASPPSFARSRREQRPDAAHTPEAAYDSPEPYQPMQCDPPLDLQRTPLRSGFSVPRSPVYRTTPSPKTVGSATRLRSKTPPSAARRTPPSCTIDSVSRRSREPSTESAAETTPAPSTPGFIRQRSMAPQVTPPPLLRGSESPARRHLLPPIDPYHQGGLTVVFDLDETLVSNRQPGTQAAVIRPFIDEMFRHIEGLAEVVMWTASTDDTGRPVVEQIDPHRRRFHHLIFRNGLWFTEPSHTKDLALLGRSMDKVLLIENTPNCCKFHRYNSLLVEDFTPALVEDRTMLTVAQIVSDAAAAVRRGITVQNFLQIRSQLREGVEKVEHGLPPAFHGMSCSEALQTIEQLPPLLRPPLGNFFYVKPMVNWLQPR